MVVMTTQPTDEQRAFLAASRVPGSAVMAVGGPGTGKTTALVEAVAQAVGAGARLEQLVILTWSRPDAQRLRRAIVERLGASQLAPVITTVPGWCLGLQERFGTRDAAGELPRLLTGPEQDLQVRELLAAAGPELWPPALRAAIGTAAFAQQVRTGLARARQHGMDPADLEEAGRRAGRPEWVGLGRFFEHYLDVLDAERAWDYTELVHRSRLLMLDETIRDRLAEQTGGLFCDEFAECDPAQIGLMAQVHAMGVTVAVAADPQTSAFGFRGADPRAALDFTTRFAVIGGSEPVRVDFRTVHRGSDAVRAGVVSLLDRLPRAGAPGPPPAPTGAPRAPSGAEGEERRGSTAQPSGSPATVRCLEHESLSSQAQAVAQELRAAHLGGVPWAEQAVICRSGKGGLSVLAGSLAGLGIPVEVAGDEIALAEQTCVLVLLDALRLVLDMAEGHPADDDRQRLIRILNSPLSGLDPAAVRQLGRTLWSAQPHDGTATGEDLVLRRLAACAVLSGSVVGTGALQADDACDPRETAVVDLGRLLGAAARDVGTGRSGYDVLWRLWAGTGWPGRLRSDALGSGTTATAANKDLDAVCALFDMASRHVELTGARGLRMLIAQIEGQEIPGDVARESDPRGRGVRVLTAHRGRGHEWEHVILVDATEGQWPGPRRGEGLVAAPSIGEEQVQPDPGAAGWIQQERRLFLLAASRARRELGIHAVVGGGDERSAVSRFVTEFGAEVVESGRPTVRQRTLDALVGELRRSAVDPQSSGALRAAAVGELRRLSELRDDRGELLVASARPDQWWGLRRARTATGDLDDTDRQPVRLSVTGLERITRCPRCWFLDNQAGGAEPAGTGAGIGSLIHLLAEQSVTADLGLPGMHDAVDDFWPRLGFDVDWRGEQERRATHEMVDRLGRWAVAPRGREVLGVEIPIEYELDLGGDLLVLTGTIDRLELETASGRVWIVDFKTGRRAASRKEAASNVQLACYQLVVAGGACAGHCGGSPRVGGAELVWLRVPASAKRPDMPKVVAQPSLADHPYPPDAGPDSTLDGPTWIHDIARAAVGRIRSGQYPALENPACGYCPHRADCPLWAGTGGRR